MYDRECTGRREAAIRWSATLILAVAVGTAALADGGRAELPETYAGLLADEQLTRAIVWEGDDGPVAYPDWPSRHRSDLASMIHLLEQREQALAQCNRCPADEWDRPAAPAEESGSPLTPDRTWAIYLEHVAHALWLEAGRRVSWSLRSLTSEQLALLLDGRELFDYVPGRNLYTFGPAGAAADPVPAFGYRLMRTRELVGASQEETVWALANWLRKRMQAPSGPPRPHEPLSELKSLANLLLPPDGVPPTVADCHELAGVMVALLRSVNVPAAAPRVRLSVPGRRPSIHSRVELPTLGRTVADASVLVMPLLRPIGNVVPTTALFATSGWVAENVLHPQQLDCRGARCNRPEDQALFNMTRRSIELAVSHLPDGLLVRRAEDPGPGSPARSTDALLSGHLDLWGGEPFAKPFYGPAERRAIVHRIDEELERVGEGDWHLGAERVRHRWLAAQPGHREAPVRSDSISPARPAGPACDPDDPESPKDGGSTPTRRSDPGTDRSPGSPSCGDPG